LPNFSLRRAIRLAYGVPFAAAVLFAAPALANTTGGVSFAGTIAPTSAPSKLTTTTRGSGQLGSRVLRSGMRGSDVTILQGDLTLAGFATGVDGDFGSQTKQAVLAFQRARGLTANGVVTAAVAKTLSAAVSALQTGGPVQKAHINPDGTATAPADAPPAVKAVIAAANQIIDKPYIYAGGHSSWIAPGYDCSGAVSYALHGGGLLSAPLAVEFEGYGSPGPGKWITIYADSSHVFAAIAGLAFDTADYGGPNIPAGTGPRWRYNPTGNLADGGNYVVRHPPNF
jgi:Putative peptidoglycan binding domain